MTTFTIEVDDQVKVALDQIAQQMGKSVSEVIADFARSRTEQAGDTKPTAGTIRMSKGYRQKLLQVGVWTDEDLKPIEDAQKNWNFEAPQW